MPKPTLVIGRSDRLIARLKSTLLAWRFLNQVNGRLIVNWPNIPQRYGDECFRYSPAELFDLVQLHCDRGDELIFVEQRPMTFPPEATNLGDPEYKDYFRNGFPRDMFEGRDTLFANRGTAPFFFEDESAARADFPNQMSDLFHTLPLNIYIKTHLNRFYEKTGLGPGEYIALHIRRGDCYDMLLNELNGEAGASIDPKRVELLVGHFAIRTAPAEYYAEGIEQALSTGKKIVFTSDSPETIGTFRKKYGAREFIDLSMFKMAIDIQKAFLDFLIIKNAAYVIGTSSNFSYFAAQLGKIDFYNATCAGPFEILQNQLETEILDHLDVPDETQALMMQKLEKEYNRINRIR
ncbi:hypothetical protein HFP57_13680 [Parasphingopyxis algicola]|uniref:hypothetical protein n=1 Tax=Parasphingopyxis algicola TaxID=2026624 RepID=UPI0015A4A506|nr:hypothetical protein [Parasphingopyxis algicola]QLC25969.1 hypothetical protein HFP57_13680 [Parasphingopyxis algicola]